VEMTPRGRPRPGGLPGHANPGPGPGGNPGTSAGDPGPGGADPVGNPPGESVLTPRSLPSLLHLDRYRNEGTRVYSPHAGYSEARERYRPDSRHPSFHLPVFQLPVGDMRVFEANPPPALRELYLARTPWPSASTPRSWRRPPRSLPPRTLALGTRGIPFRWHPRPPPGRSTSWTRGPGGPAHRVGPADPAHPALPGIPRHPRTRHPYPLPGGPGQAGRPPPRPEGPLPLQDQPVRTEDAGGGGGAGRERIPGAGGGGGLHGRPVRLPPGGPGRHPS
jgi:hypothetical protein